MVDRVLHHRLSSLIAPVNPEDLVRLQDLSGIGGASTADEVEVSPPVFGQTDVQAVLEHVEQFGSLGTAWTHTEDAFNEPPIGGLVTIDVEQTAWMDVGAPLFIAGNTYQVVSVDSPTEVTLRRLAAASAGFSNVMTQFTPPAAGGTVQIEVDSTAWMDVGAPLLIAQVTYVVMSVDSPTEVTLERLA